MRHENDEEETTTRNKLDGSDALSGASKHI